jgi:hypothetical protein
VNVRFIDDVDEDQELLGVFGVGVSVWHRGDHAFGGLAFTGFGAGAEASAWWCSARDRSLSSSYTLLPSRYFELCCLVSRLQGQLLDYVPNSFLSAAAGRPSENRSFHGSSNAPKHRTEREKESGSKALPKTTHHLLKREKVKSGYFLASG